MTSTESTPVSANSAVEDPDMWVPGPDYLVRSRALELVRLAGCTDIAELIERADLDPAWFWGLVPVWLGLPWQTPPTNTVDGLASGHEASWFPGAEFNIADACVDRWIRAGRGDAQALKWEMEDGARGSWSFRELAEQVDRLSIALKDLGVTSGDRVGMQLPMVKEAAVVMLACAKIGAVAVPVFSGFGADAVVERLNFAGARVHVVASSYQRRGKHVDVRGQIARQMAAVQTLQHTIVVDVESLPGDTVPAFPGEISYEDLTARRSSAPVETEWVGSDQPLLIAFTSGSTGKPKGVVLGQVGFAVKAGFDAAYSFDIGDTDTATWITDPGWIMSPIVVLGGLLNGSAVAMFPGTPDYPGPDRVWRFVRDHGVTMLGLSPTLVRLLMGNDATPPADSVARLRVLASSGEPWTPDAYHWLHSVAMGGSRPIINYSGGTEVSGGILSNTTAEPIHPCAFSGALPGMGADVADVDGERLALGLGELVLRTPSPGMPLTFWADPDRYVDTYWRRWPGIWHHGDFAERHEGAWYIRGRSDDTMKIAGKRVGPAEVEAVVNSVPGVIESAAIGLPDPVKGDALVVFVRARREFPSDGLVETVQRTVAERLGRALLPKRVHVVPALPRTRSGKILRRLIKATCLGTPVGDTSAVDNPESLRHIEATR